MVDSSPTRASLLVRIRDRADVPAWQEFYEIYSPLIHSYLRHRGLQDADAADLTQDVLQTVSSKAGEFNYDPKKGSFRGWLFTVTRNKLRDLVEKRKRRAVASGDTNVATLLRQQADPQSDEQVWNQHHQWSLFLWAAEKVRADFRPATWDAFWKVTVESKPAKEVAGDLQLSVGAVHIAKSRVLAKLRERLQAIGDE